jgi:hypothetical protein
MFRRAVQFIVGSVVLLSLAGCGLFRFEQRAPWRDQAERACLASGQVKITPYVEPAREIDGPGSCGMVQPFRVSAFAGGNVGLTSRALLACPMLPAIDRWVMETVRPAARIYFRAELVEMKVGSYACRNKNHSWGGSKSEHAFGNALDVMAFTLADGRTITVAKGWRGSRHEQEFLREVLVGSCRVFSTVLGPGADPYHYDHFHLDLARHADGRRICKPVLKFEPRIDYSVKPAPMTPRPFDPSRPKPSDVEEMPDDFEGAGLPRQVPGPSGGAFAAASSGAAPPTNTTSAGIQGRIETNPLPPLQQQPQPAAPGRPSPLGPVASVPPGMPSAPPPRGPLVLGTPAPGTALPPPRPPVMGGLY